MTDSKSTDKLVAMTSVVNQMFEKLPLYKVQKTKELSICWKVFDEDDELSHPQPKLKLSFHN